jgi:hypothetical protein
MRRLEVALLFPFFCRSWQNSPARCLRGRFLPEQLPPTLPVERSSFPRRRRNRSTFDWTEGALALSSDPHPALLRGDPAFQGSDDGLPHLTHRVLSVADPQGGGDPPLDLVDEVGHLSCRVDEDADVDSAEDPETGVGSVSVHQVP